MANKNPKKNGAAAEVVLGNDGETLTKTPVYGVDLNWEIQSDPDDLGNAMNVEEVRFIGTKDECEQFVKENKPAPEVVTMNVTDGRPPTVAELQANHPTMKWFDEFHVRIQKKTVRNVLVGRDETIITGWELVKKLMPKFIEPLLAKSFNRFANGYNVENVGQYFVLKDSMTTGDVITYKTWADEQGIDPKSDINQLLA